MTQAPRRWTTQELADDAAVAAAGFRADRLAVSDAWHAHYYEARAKFESLFGQLNDLRSGAVTDEALAAAYTSGLGEAVRYLAGPPMSEDDLRVIADVRTMAPAALRKSPRTLRRVFEVIERIIDPHRFPWVAAGTAPTQQQREAALLASSALLAAQRIATARRNEGKQGQETKLKDYLCGLGFAEVPAAAIHTIVRGPQAMQFCAECLLGDRKADVVVRLHDTRLLAIECKVSNSSTNSVKRLNNDAAVKAVYWLGEFGPTHVVPAALLAGVFKVLNLEQAQERGLALYWSHALDRLGAFIDSAR